MTSLGNEKLVLLTYGAEPFLRRLFQYYATMLIFKSHEVKSVRMSVTLFNIVTYTQPPQTPESNDVFILGV
jgi:hypothetical protein